MTMYSRWVLGACLALVMGCAGGDEKGEAELSDEARFSKDMAKEECEILTPEMVGKTFSLAPNDLEQNAMVGCIYRWEAETEELKASIMMARAHKSEKAAAEWFAMRTKQRSAEEMKAAETNTLEELEEDGKLDSEAKKKAAEGAMDLMGSQGEAFADLPDVGDEARVDRDGEVYVRVDNLTFNVSAYKGPKEPDVNLGGGSPDDMMKAAKKHAAEWTEKTAEQRRKDSTRLAKAIVAAL